MALYSLVELTRHDRPPHRLSMAPMLRAFRRVLRDYRHPRQRSRTRRDRLRHSFVDPYPKSHKAGRDDPRTKQDTTPAAPKSSQRHNNQSNGHNPFTPIMRKKGDRR